MPNIRDHDNSVYLKLQGDCLHIGGYEVDPVLIEGVTSVSFPLIEYYFKYSLQLNSKFQFLIITL